MDTGDFENPLKTVVEKVQFKQLDIDSNWVFFLHRKATYILLQIIISSFVCYCIGDFDSFACLPPPRSTWTPEMFTPFCWAQGTFIVLERLNGTLGKHFPHPGVGRIYESDTVLYQRAYPWMYPYIATLMLLFRFPWWLWKKVLEKGRISSLAQEINSIIVTSDTLNKRKKVLVDYFLLNMHYHNLYAYSYIICEFLNLFHVFFQVWFTDILLQGEFTTYGLDVFKFLLLEDQQSRIDPLARNFPKVTICHVKIFGPSGNLQPEEGLCVLPLNNWLEKVFVLLWFWFLLLTIASILNFVYRLLTIYVPCLRYWLLRLRARRVNPESIRYLCSKCKYGDWFVIFSLKNTLDSWVFDEILEELADKLKPLENCFG